MMITVGIPFYNAEQYLRFSIISVLNQTYSDFELILSDDGSSDNSLKIAKSFNDPRIKILSDRKNMGIAFRINEQISISKGVFFARMDADDVMLPDRLEKQVQFLLRNPDIDVIGSYAWVINNENSVYGLRKSKIPGSIYECFSNIPFIHPTVMGKIEWFKEFLYTEEFTGVEDADLWIRSFTQSSFFIIEEPLLFYRDPLKLKFSTYKFRVFQLQKLYKKHMDKLGATELLFKVKDILKLSIYWISTALLFDRYLIMRRNMDIDDKMYLEASIALSSIINTAQENF